MASCQRVALEPYAWFKDVLSRIAAHADRRTAAAQLEAFSGLIPESGSVRSA